MSYCWVYRYPCQIKYVWCSMSICRCCQAFAQQPQWSFVDEELRCCLLFPEACACGLILFSGRALGVWLYLITTVPIENVAQRQSHLVQTVLSATFLYKCSSITQPDDGMETF